MHARWSDEGDRTDLEPLVGLICRGWIDHVSRADSDAYPIYLHCVGDNGRVVRKASSLGLLATVATARVRAALSDRTLVYYVAS